MTIFDCFCAARVRAAEEFAALSDGEDLKSTCSYFVTGLERGRVLTDFTRVEFRVERQQKSIRVYCSFSFSVQDLFWER